MLHTFQMTLVYDEKPFTNLFPWNQWADFNETWYEASGKQVRHSFSNGDPELTLTHFTTISTIVE